jgi:CRP-like cAMP-binding protein
MDTTAAKQESNELYRPLSEQIRQRLERNSLRKTVPAGSRLICHGVAPAHLVIINTGSSEISVPTLGKPRSLGVVGSGKVLGLHSVVSGLLPDVDVVCLQECLVTLIPRQEFIGALEQYPEIYLAVARVLSSDLKMAYDLHRVSLRARH